MEKSKEPTIVTGVVQEEEQGTSLPSQPTPVETGSKWEQLTFSFA